MFAAARLGPLGDDAGAEFIGQWYLRNIRMYANICRSTRDADQRVLVIVGNGHRPIIEQVLRADPDEGYLPDGLQRQKSDGRTN